MVNELNPKILGEWLAGMGSDKTVLQIKNDKYKVSFDRVGKEIDRAFGLEFFEKSLSKAVRDALHSYTHSGGFQIARRFDENTILAILAVASDLPPKHPKRLTSGILQVGYLLVKNPI